MACIGGIDTVTGEDCGNEGATAADLLRQEQFNADAVEAIDFTDDGNPIFYDSRTDQFFVNELVGDPATNSVVTQRRNLPPNSPIMQQVFGKAASGGLSISPTAAAQLAESVRQFDATLAQRILENNQGVELQRDQLEQSDEQFNARLQQDANQFNAQLEQNRQEFNLQQQQQRDLANQAAEIRFAELNSQIARDQAQLDLAIRREEVAVAEGNRAARQQAAALIEQTTARVQANQLQRTQLTTQVQQFNANLDQQEQQFNAQQELAVAQFNETARLNNLALQQQNAADIGVLAANASDVGEVAARLRAGDSITSQIGRDDNAITARSVEPLSELLGIQQELQRGPAQFAFNPVDFGQVAAPEFGEINDRIPTLEELTNNISFDGTPISLGGPMDASGFIIGSGGQIQAGPGVTAATAATPNPLTGGLIDGVNSGQPADPTGLPTASTFQIPSTFSPEAAGVFESLARTSPDRAINIDPNLTTNQINDFFAGLVQPMAKGGSTFAPVRLVGEQGPEIEIDQPDGSTVVIPNHMIGEFQDGGEFRGSLPESTERIFFPGDIATQNAANSTGATGQTGQIANPLVGATGAQPLGTSGTFDFLRGVGQDALDRFNVTRINQITPVGNSAPGTSRFLQEGAASVASALGFGPVSLFMEQLNAARPQGVSNRVTRRTA